MINSIKYLELIKKSWALQKELKASLELSENEFNEITDLQKEILNISYQTTINPQDIHNNIRILSHILRVPLNIRKTKYSEISINVKNDDGTEKKTLYFKGFGVYKKNQYGEQRMSLKSYWIWRDMLKSDILEVVKPLCDDKTYSDISLFLNIHQEVEKNFNIVENFTDKTQKESIIFGDDDIGEISECCLEEISVTNEGVYVDLKFGDITKEICLPHKDLDLNAEKLSVLVNYREEILNILNKFIESYKAENKPRLEDIKKYHSMIMPYIVGDLL